MKVTQSTTSSTAGPHIPVPHDLPALPGSDLAALRARIDAWDGTIPTAREAAGSYTRASLDTAMRQAANDEPRPYDAVVLGWQYDSLQADNAFEGAA